MELIASEERARLTALPSDRTVWPLHTFRELTSSKTCTRRMLFARGGGARRGSTNTSASQRTRPGSTPSGLLGRVRPSSRPQYCRLTRKELPRRRGLVLRPVTWRCRLSPELPAMKWSSRLGSRCQSSVRKTRVDRLTRTRSRGCTGRRTSPSKRVFLWSPDPRTRRRLRCLRRTCGRCTAASQSRQRNCLFPRRGQSGQWTAARPLRPRPRQTPQRTGEEMALGREKGDSSEKSSGASMATRTP